MTYHSNTQEGITPIHEFLQPEENFDEDPIVSSMGWMLAITAGEIEQPLEEYSLILCPATDGETFTVFRATERMQIPDGALLEGSPQITSLTERGYQYNLLRCRLVAPEAIEEIPTENLITFPPELEGKTIQETTSLSESLWESILVIDPFDEAGDAADSE